MIEIESAPDDGLLGLVHRAERAILEQTTDPVGVVGLELCAPPPDLPVVTVEAAFVERAGLGVVERLEVCLELATPPSRERLLALLAAAGDGRYTSLCLRSAERELLDVTLHHGSLLRVLGRCAALVADALDEREARHCQRVLATLGIESHPQHGQLRVSRRRLGSPPTPQRQADALLLAREGGMRAELFAAKLPVRRSVRVALGAGPTRVTLSRQIPRDATSIARDALELRELVERELGFDFGPRRWGVTNAHGQSEPHRPHGPVDRGQRVEWSLNWGARRR